MQNREDIVNMYKVASAETERLATDNRDLEEQLATAKHEHEELKAKLADKQRVKKTEREVAKTRAALGVGFVTQGTAASTPPLSPERWELSKGAMVPTRFIMKRGGSPRSPLSQTLLRNSDGKPTPEPEPESEAERKAPKHRSPNGGLPASPRRTEEAAATQIQASVRRRQSQNDVSNLPTEDKALLVLSDRDGNYRSHITPNGQIFCTHDNKQVERRKRVKLSLQPPQI